MSAPSLPRLVVGVGASAGGLEAFRCLLYALPPDTGMAFVLVQHLDPAHDSLLRELLEPFTSMPVVAVEHDQVLSPDTVYTMRPDKVVAVRDGRIALSDPAPRHGARVAVDHLFHSLARDFRARAVGIVLSGAGSDGSAGVRDIRTAGGLVLVQDPETSGQPGMPRSAIETGGADLVLPIEEMPRALERFAKLPTGARRIPRGDEEAIPPPDGVLDAGDLRNLGALLRAHLGFDLRVYKTGTIERRVRRRMSLAGFDRGAEYVEHLRTAHAEQEALVRDLLINVTDFFRDIEAFQALRELVVEPLVARAEPGTSLRIWVPGCATGEEAYSIAIELLEVIEAHDKRLTVQLFATDIDQDALSFGRAAIYPPAITERISENRLKRWFKAVRGRGYQVRSELRDVVSFAVHDLTRDPPFSRMHLVSCRNVLIYLTPEAQDHVLQLLHFALSRDGHLFLSPSESTGRQRDLFTSISKSHRIYRKVGVSRPISVRRSREWPAQEETDVAPPPVATSPRRGIDAAQLAVIQAWAPPTVIVSEDEAVLFMHGELSAYLRFPQGDSSRLDLGALLRPGLATRTRGALYRCRRSRESVVALSTPEQGRVGRVRITAQPVDSLGEGVVMLSFEDVADSDVAAAPPESPAQEVVIDELERELRATREDLRHTAEELETSNEELRASHEESMSMNEELQSANEELEATTEELRSLNEELTTVNSQLRDKVDELEQANDDLRNFFASAKIATVFLDERLHIKRTTPAARDLLGITDADTGRCATDFARELLQNDLAQEAAEVLEDLTPRRREIATAGGRWISRQILPYRTESRRIEGVVVTFADVTERRASAEALEARSRRLGAAWNAARGGIYEHRIPLDETTYQSEQWARMLGYRPDELPPYDRFLDWLKECLHPKDRDRQAAAYEDFVEGRTERYQVEVRVRHRSGHWLWVRAISKALDRDDEGRVRHLLGTMIDITDLKRVEQDLRESESRFREMTDGLPLIVWVHDENGQQTYVNQTLCDFFGVSREEMVGGRWQMLMHPEDVEAYNAEFLACVRDKRPFHAEARVREAGGSWRWLESWGRPRFTPDGEFRGFVGTSADITERKWIEAALAESEERFRTMADNISQLAWMADGTGQIVWYNHRWYEFTGATPEAMAASGWQVALHPDHAERVATRLQRSIQTGEHWEDVFMLRASAGEYHWFLSRALPIRDEHGSVIRWFGTHTDITHQRAIEQRLRQAHQQKDEFLAMLGHELRNPLAAIRSATEVLKLMTHGDPRFERMQATLDRQTAHMAKLLDGLLDVSRIIRGKISIEREIADLAAICRDVVTDVAESPEGRQRVLSLDAPDEAVPVEGDPVRLAQIVDNLLSNAVKFTPPGGSVAVSLTPEGGTATLRVRDTGAGIDADLLPHIFEVFRQSKQSLDRSHGGLGLGLALVRSLAELHGGSVEAFSEGPGAGAEFLVRLPMAYRPAFRPPERAESPNEGLRILVVEDDEDAAEMLRLALDLAGHEVTVADRGRAAVALARELLPDVIICDLGLPDGMNGFDVARTLRADERTKAIPLIALSGYGRPEDRARGAEAGFDTHITKPVDLEVIERAVAKLSRGA